MSKKYTFGSIQELTAWTEELVVQLPNPAILYLYGELGSGKTTFVKQLAESLGVLDEVTSPTFTIVSEYQITSHPSLTTLVHVDLYRLGQSAADDPVVQEVLGKQAEPGRLTVIEWADNLTGTLLPGTWQLTFTDGGSIDERRVTIQT